MNCPSCAAQLVRTTYEGLPVFRCDECSGYLLGRKRVDGIKRSRGKSVEQLKEETLGESQEDTKTLVRCPRCRMKMKKDLLPEPVSLHVDRCGQCDLIWLDGGELARVQLGHEMTPQGRDAAEMQRRHKEMDPERRREFEENLAKLPERESLVLGALKEALTTRRRRGWR
ncbi:MAG: zf-TFIIB domain-containing protein [Thermoguttaceae bacterium]